MENEVFKVTGGSRLSGQVHVPGAKNSALKLMTASLLAAGTTQLENVPDIADVEIMAELLTRLGAQVNRDISNSTLEIKVPENLSISLMVLI